MDWNIVNNNSPFEIAITDFYGIHGYFVIYCLLFGYLCVRTICLIQEPQLHYFPHATLTLLLSCTSTSLKH